ncbi:uncharacterized protein LOC121864184 [Homarus americanus]|uniref:MARVEL domain-containing protein n=1 Tax=Homarus americanus TaxID=6706 RepID=A0A8J5KDX7_HOMAM|nr:uncharacterized protein LOC121864184 [Homarus americanus]KAG7170658.1 hypothetical protein Hamer_G013477 [Homarus americanus]
MEIYRRSQFVVSPPAILKIIEMVVLVTGMVLFMVSNKCDSNASYVTLFVLPCGVCVALTLVSYITAMLVLAGGRNPLTTPTWVKGDVIFNVAALVLMVVGSIITLTNQACSNTSITVAAIAMGLISAILFATSAATTYLLLTRHHEQVKESQREQLENRRVTLSVIA